MSDKKDIIKKELDKVDKQENPEDPNRKPHGEPETEREKLRREQFIELYGREEQKGQKAEKLNKEKEKSQKIEKSNKEI